MTWEEVKAEMDDLLRDKSPDQVIAYIENNVNDLASAKAVIKKLAIVLLFMFNNTGYRSP